MWCKTRWATCSAMFARRPSAIRRPMPPGRVTCAGNSGRITAKSRSHFIITDRAGRRMTEHLYGYTDLPDAGTDVDCRIGVHCGARAGVALGQGRAAGNHRVARRLPDARGHEVPVPRVRTETIAARTLAVAGVGPSGLAQGRQRGCTADRRAP